MLFRAGYRLAKSPDTITLLDIIEAIEGLPTLNTCLVEDTRCTLYADAKYHCKAHHELYRIQTILRQELGRKSLSELFAETH